MQFRSIDQLVCRWNYLKGLFSFFFSFFFFLGGGGRRPQPPQMTPLREVTIWKISFIINSSWLLSLKKRNNVIFETFCKRHRNFFRFLIFFYFLSHHFCTMIAYSYYSNVDMHESVDKMKPMSLWRRAFWVWNILHSRHLRVNPWTINYLTPLALFFHVSEWRNAN